MARIYRSGSEHPNVLYVTAQLALSDLQPFSDESSGKPKRKAQAAKDGGFVLLEQREYELAIS